MNIDLKFYWKLFLARLPAMMLLFLIFSGIGIMLAVKLPTIYKTGARLLVEDPQITEFTNNGVAAAETLDIVQQRLLTRANLIDIANKRNVFADRPGMNPDQIVSAMRQATRISRSSGRDRATIMSIDFSASKARVAADVVNDYVTLILEENARLRTGRAEDNLAFYVAEVDRLSKELSLQSERILAFKNANSDALPDSLNYRLTRRDALQETVARVQRETEGLKGQRERIVSIYESTGRLQAPVAEQLSPEERQLQALRSELQTALAVYSETSPRVRILQTRIAALETSVAAQSGGEATPDGVSTQEALFSLSLSQIDSQIEALANELEAAQREIANLNDSIARTSPNQIALDTLQRDYSNIQLQYNSAVARSNTARMGERVELSAKGQRITVLEQANVPNNPSSPNREGIASAGIAAGLGAAAGLFLLLELLNRSIRRPIEVTRAIGITPIGVIPYIESARHRWMRRMLQVTTLVAVIIGVPATLWAIDTYYLPIDLIVERVIARIGIV